MQLAGIITELTRQVEYDLVVNGELVGRYTPDWTYKVMDELVVEEHKGRWTEASRLRVKLFLALYRHTCRYVVSGTPLRKKRTKSLVVKGRGLTAKAVGKG